MCYKKVTSFGRIESLQSVFIIQIQYVVSIQVLQQLTKDLHECIAVLSRESGHSPYLARHTNSYRRQWCTKALLIPFA